MTDTEIIKALEYCSKNTNPFICTENKCPLFGEKCIDILTENALALINRQQAKIERLKQERDREHNYCNHYARMCAKSKSEAYKEFVTKAEKKAQNAQTWTGIEPVVTVSDLNNILKEME